MYDTLFQPVTINHTVLKNRVVMAPMSTNLGKGGGGVSEDQINYYTEKARNEVGLIITEAMSVHPTGAHRVRKMSLMKDDYIPELRRLTDSVHRFGTAIIAQINHQGRTVTFMPDGYSAMAPSPIASRKTGIVPREMTQEDIQELLSAFAKAAMRAEQAGFDGVEVHGGHGYLITQFLSKRWNKRDDKYGGSLDNRMRFPLELVDVIRASVSSDFIVSYRIESNEYAENGVTLSESCKLAELLQEHGVNVINVVGGNNEVPEEQFKSIATMYTPDCYFVEAAEEIKKHVTVPVMVAGKIRTPEEAEDIINGGNVDLILLGRTLVADPEWAVKTKEGRAQDIHRCVSCNAGCISKINEQQSISCVQNTLLGTCVSHLKHAEKSLNIAVVGAGITGLEFSLRAAQRGHKVTVWDKSPVPGGQVLLAAASPDKGVFKELINWRYKECKENGVAFYFNTPFDVHQDLSKYDKIVVATGASPIRLQIKGNKQTIDAWDVFDGSSSYGGWKKAVIVGAGATGLELAHLLGHHGIETIIVEMTENVGANVVPTVRAALLNELRRYSVDIRTKAPIVSYNDGVVVCGSDGSTTTIENVDAVITAVGVGQNKSLVDELTEINYDAENIICLGDANGRGDILVDSASAFEAALAL